jgi:hypothetical protein
VVSTKRISLTRNGQVCYELKTPWRNGTTHVIFEPLDFISRLVALVPKPRVNLTRFHGVFGIPQAPSLVAADQFTLLRLKPVVNAAVMLGSLPVLKIRPEIGRAEGDEQQPILISDIYLT